MCIKVHGIFFAEEMMSAETTPKKEFDSYIGGLNEPLMINDIITDIIVQTGRKCLDGNISPSEAAEEAIKQLELKMKE